MIHGVYYEGHKPLDYDGWIKPVCTCGWVGKPESNYSNVQHSNLREQVESHLSGVKK